MSAPARYLGMRPGDLDGKPYAKFWNLVMQPLPEQAREAVLRGPVAGELLPRLAEAPRLLEPGYQTVEDGYSLQDGALHVAVRTEMPGTSPAMIDWWFGWHSEEPERYKLWHPQAHVHAEWETPATTPTEGRARYIGRTSIVDEYIGHERRRFAIRFLDPVALGFDSEALADPERATAICARGGFAGFPVDGGYLVHHVRRTQGGSEMRSRFWMGGPYVGGRSAVGSVVASIGRHLIRPTALQGQAMLVHCSQEMSHLASFLPRLYAELGDGIPD